MDRINSLKRNDVLKALQQSTPYKNKTYKQIEELVGKEIYHLRTTLRNIEVGSLRPVERTILNEIQQPLLPNDVIVESLLRSDLQTIINTCSTHKQYQQLCNNDFWIKKFDHDGLPVIKDKDAKAAALGVEHSTFKAWAQEYALLTKFKIETQCLLHIVKTEYQNNLDGSTIIVHMSYGNDRFWVPSFITDQGIVNDFLISLQYKNGWYLNKIQFNQHDVEKLIIYILYQEYKDVKNKQDIDISINFDSGNIFIYSTLILNKIKKELNKKRTQYDRTLLAKYLFSYQLLMSK